MIEFNGGSDADFPPQVGGTYGHHPDHRSPNDLWRYLALLWRRKWIILPFLILTPIVAYLALGRGAPVYQASAEVFLNRQSGNISGLGDPSLVDPERSMLTQADIARLPVIARRVVAAAGLPWDPNTFLNESSVVFDDQVDLFTFQVRDRNPGRARLLANLYAEQYIKYSRQLATAPYRDGLSTLGPQIAALKEQKLSSSAAYSALIQRQQQMQTALVLQASNAQLVRPAEGASLVASPARRTLLLGFSAGIILALALAFLVDGFDTRIRTPEEIAEDLRLPLIASVPEPRRLRHRGGLLMLEAPGSAGAARFRNLGRTVSRTVLSSGRRSLVVTSPLESEGKSTTAANLAVALARDGRRVLLVELDFEHASLERLFDLPAGPGVVDVISGKASLAAAVTRIPLAPRLHEPRFVGKLNVFRARFGTSPPQNGGNPGSMLEVLRSGTSPPDTDDASLTSEFDAVLERMGRRADLIILNCPPLLGSDLALRVSSECDALLLVARMKTLRREHVSELKWPLAAAATPPLEAGLVVIGNPALRRHATYQSVPGHEAVRRVVT